MITINTGLLALIVLVAAFVTVAVVAIRADNAKNERWIEHMREIGRRCPNCGGAGFHLLLPAGRPDSAPTCATCGGSGRLPATSTEEGGHAR